VGIVVYRIFDKRRHSHSCIVIEIQMLTWITAKCFISFWATNWGKIGFSVLHCFDPELIINYTDAGNLI